MKLELSVIDDRTLEISGSTYELRGVIRQAGGKWSKKRKVWTLPNQASFAQRLQEMAQIQVDFPPSIEQAGLCQKQALLAKTGPPQEVPLAKLPPWDHQKRAYWFARKRERVLFAMDMGTGKSAPVVWLAEDKKKVLITCPKSVLNVWPLQFSTHGTNPLPVTVLEGKWSTKRKLKAAMDSPEAGVIVVNHESLWREPLWSWVKKQKWDMLVVDECHRAKGAGTKVSKKLADLAPAIPMVLGLTGTPLPHSPLDIYGQARFIDAGMFGTNFHSFKGRYARQIAMSGPYGSFQKIVGFINQDEMAGIMSKFSYEVSADDVLDLPPKQYITREFDLSRDERRIYEEVKKDLISTAKDRTITAANALVKVIRLAQICGGHSTDDAGMPMVFGDSKEKCFQDMLADIYEPTIAFCRFRADLDAVHSAAKANGLKSGELSGRENQLQEWQDSKTDVLAVQIQAGGAGIDLTRARICINYSVGYSLGDFLQSQARIHRPGQTRPVTYYNMVASNTIEGKLYEALRNKKQIVDFVMSLL